MTDVDTMFKRAVAHIAASKVQASNDIKLEVYAYYKIATTAVTPQSIGTSRPGMFDFAGRAKYDAWTRYGTQLQEENTSSNAESLAQLAEQRYVSIAESKFAFDTQSTVSTPAQSQPTHEKSVDELLDEEEEQEEQLPPSTSGSTSNGGGMVSVSTMNTRSAASDELEHSILHELALQGDASGIEALKPTAAQLNSLNEDGFAPIHLAADRGHLDVVRLLMQLGADPNLPDSEGLTALDTASAVENDAIVAMLQTHTR